MPLFATGPVGYIPDTKRLESPDLRCKRGVRKPVFPETRSSVTCANQKPSASAVVAALDSLALIG